MYSHATPCLNMTEFPVQIIDQLPVLLKAFRQQAGLTQAEAAAHLGVSQQVFSSLERHPEKVSVGRLYRLLRILNVQMVLSSRSQDQGQDSKQAAEGQTFPW